MAKDISLLDRVTIPEPCPASWRAMRGDTTRRFCDQCGKHVYNLSAMTVAEAERVIADQDDSLCAQFRRRRDGRILTRWEPRRPGIWLPRWVRSLVAAAIGMIALVNAGCALGGKTRTGGSVRMDHGTGAIPAEPSTANAPASTDAQGTAEPAASPAGSLARAARAE
jgi:hypothetical protein